MPPRWRRESPANLARELELIRCRVAMCVAAQVADNTCTAIDAANVPQRDVDDALVPIVEDLEKAAGVNPPAMFEAQEGSAN
jgi:hypothetical protein